MLFLDTVKECDFYWKKKALDILDLGILMLVVALCIVTGVTSTF